MNISKNAGNLKKTEEAYVVEETLLIVGSLGTAQLGGASLLGREQAKHVSCIDSDKRRQGRKT